MMWEQRLAALVVVSNRRPRDAEISRARSLANGGLAPIIEHVGARLGDCAHVWGGRDDRLSERTEGNAHAPIEYATLRSG